MKIVLVLSCLLAVTMAAPTHNVAKELLKLLRKELAEEEAPQGLAAMKRDVAALKEKASTLLKKRGLNNDAAEMAEFALDIARRMTVEGMQNEATSTCQNEVGGYEAAKTSAEEFVANPTDRPFDPNDSCFDNAVAEALARSNDPVSADIDPPDCKDKLIDVGYCNYFYDLAIQWD